MMLAVAMLAAYAITLPWVIPELIAQSKHLKTIPGRKGA